VNAKNVRAVGDRIEDLVRELGSSPDPRVRERAEDLVRLLMELYGSGLARIVDIATAAQGAAPELLKRLTEDPLVASLLLLHDLHPLDAPARIQKALNKVRPYLGSHGGDVTLLGLEDGVVRLRLEGSCNGCGSSTVTMKLAVERAIEEAAPEVVRIEVEGVADPEPKSPLIQIQRPGARAALSAQTRPGHGGWIAVDDRLDLSHGGPAGMELAGQKVVLCRSGDTFYAYRDACPSCGSALGGGNLSQAVLACPSCHLRYDIRVAGRCLDERHLHLEPLPLLQEKGAIRIAVPAAP
jgi:Fe-S cluster biogenesis protein NfuA/nitrite reductase/ring-hydroxylating ferredoxin subunit